MGGQRLNDVLRHLRHLVHPEPGGGLADADLLGRWARLRDEAAFEVLLWRHGPMVFDVCRRMLRDTQEAEDAFQATFLTLARKAGSISRCDALAGWLYRVAYRIALLARAQAARRPRHDAGALELAAARPEDDTLGREMRAVLDEEIRGLPERYRLPLLLCDLQGKTQAQAAQELGCPPGTVASRLARARARLRTRLTRRGITLGAGALAGVQPTSVSAALVGTSLGAAVGSTVVSANVNLLVKGALRAMTMTKLKLATALVLTLSLLGTGTGTFVYHLAAGPPGQDERRPAAAEAEQRRDEAERDRRLTLAHKREREEEVHYRELEAEWSEVLVRAREDLLRAEARLKRLEREQAAERAREQQEMHNADQAAGLAKAQLQDLLRIMGKQNPQVTAREDKVKLEEQKLREVNDRIRAKEEVRSEDWFGARVRVMRAEENIRRLEREQAQQREQALTRLATAGELVRQAENPEAPARSGAELERRLDRLIREMSELRRTLDKGRGSKEE